MLLSLIALLYCLCMLTAVQRQEHIEYYNLALLRLLRTVVWVNFQIWTSSKMKNVIPITKQNTSNSCLILVWTCTTVLVSTVQMDAGVSILNLQIIRRHFCERKLGVRAREVKISGRTFWAWTAAGRAAAAPSSPPLSAPDPPQTPTSFWTGTATPASCFCSAPWPEWLEKLPSSKMKAQNSWFSCYGRAYFYHSNIKSVHISLSEIKQGVKVNR